MMVLAAARIILLHVKELGGDSIHSVSPEYLVDEIAAQRQQVNGCARTHPKE